MGLLSNRSNKSDDVLQGRFVRKVLTETGKDIDQAQSRYMSSRGFSENGWNDRDFTITDNSLQYSHLKRHRFVDMKTRTVGGVKKSKKSHPIHNRIIYGHYNNLVRELAYGFTEEIKQQLLKMED